MISTRLDRRTVLRGAGVAIALPVLDAMIDGRGRFGGRRAHAAVPARIVTFFKPNGLTQWLPSQKGKGFSMPGGLTALAPFQNDLTIVSGINQGIGGLYDTHGRGTVSFATGAPGTRAGAGGPSIDQVGAQKFGGATRLSSLVTTIAPFRARPDIRGAPQAVYQQFAWSAMDQFVPPIWDPALIFQKLFSTSGGSPSSPQSGSSAVPTLGEAIVKYRQSILDHAKEDATRLKAVVGAEDRQRLDAHLTSIRELERNIGTMSATDTADMLPKQAVTCSKPTSDPATPSDLSQRANVQIDLIGLALRCNITRYVSFTLGDGGANFYLCSGEHTAYHNSNSGTTLNFTRQHMGFFARLLKHMKDAQDVDGGTLLDNSIAYMSTELGNGQNHSGNNLPVVIAGRAGGKISPGHHVSFGGVARSRLLLTLLRVAGTGVTEFAGQKEPLTLPSS
jgi:hypothetical protein